MRYSDIAISIRQAHNEVKAFEWQTTDLIRNS